MSAWGEHIVPAFALGAALGAAPGPVQLLILSETARHGIGQGFRVMLGANGMLFVVLVTIALGFSTIEPHPQVLRLMRIIGGLFLVYLGVSELRVMRRGTVDADAIDVSRSRWGPTARGVMLVILNPGAWLFFGTTAAAVMAEASADGGRETAVLTAVSMTLGVSLTDFGSALVGTGSRALLGPRALTVVKTVLSVLLLGIGAAFVVQGVRGSR